MSKLRDWFDKTPTVDGPTKEELRKANSRLTQLAGGGSSVERPPKSPVVKNSNPSHWNKELREKIPPQIKKDIMKEIEWEYSDEGAKKLRHLFAMWHLNDEVWQRQRRKAINLAVYGEEDPFDERPYYHLYTFHDEFGYKKQTYPKYKKDAAMEMYKYCKKGMDKGVIGDTILLEGYKVEED